MWPFNKKAEKKRSNDGGIEIVSAVIMQLRKAGYKEWCDKDEDFLLSFYQRQGYSCLYCDELKMSILMLAELIKHYGTEEDMSDLENTPIGDIENPSNNLYYYLIPTQFIRCRQLGGEIRVRASDRYATGPEPNMNQKVLEKTYCDVYETLQALFMIQNPPQGLADNLEKFSRTVKKALKGAGAGTPVNQKIGLQPGYLYSYIDEQPINAPKNEDVYGYTDYLDGKVGYDDVGKPKGKRGQ